MNDERLRIQLDASFVTRQQRSSVLTDWVSARGVFVRTDSPPTPMSLLRVRFALPPDGAVLEMHGMVARVEPPARKSGVHGVELVFFAKTGATAKAWDQFLELARTRWPESRDRPVMLARDGVGAPPPSSGAMPAAPKGTFAPEVLAELAAGGGFFLQTNAPCTLGSDLRVSLTSSASGATFTIDAVVRRRVFGTAGGVGVEPSNLSAQTRKELEAFLRAAKADEPLRVMVAEVHAPRAPAMMNTLPGPCSQGTVRFVAGEDSWATVDGGWD